MLSKKYSQLWTVLGLILIVVPIYFIVKNLRDVEVIIRDAGIAGPVVAIFLFTVFAVTPVTTDPLAVVGGIVFGPVIGTLVALVGNTLAGIVEYHVGARIGKATNFKNLERKLPFGLNRLPVDSPWFLILGRIIPGYGSKVVSLMGGIYHVPMKRYVWTMLLTNLLGALVLAFGGSQIVHYLKL